MSKLPAFQFYPGDWLQDSVAGCSLAAQGLWLRIMYVMHSAERRGYLAVNGKAMSDQLVAARCGCDVPTYQSLFAELSAAGVPRRTSDGILFNKRMVEDERKRQDTKRRVQKHRSNADVTHLKRECNTVSSSSSSSSKLGRYGGIEGDAQNLPALTLAHRVADCISWTENLQPIAGAIQFCIDQEHMTHQEAADFVAARAIEEVARGAYPTRFFFSERKWRKPAEKKGDRGYVPFKPKAVAE